MSWKQHYYHFPYWTLSWVLNDAITCMQNCACRINFILTFPSNNWYMIYFGFLNAVTWMHVLLLWITILATTLKTLHWVIISWTLIHVKHPIVKLSSVESTHQHSSCFYLTMKNLHFVVNLCHFLTWKIWFQHEQRNLNESI